MRQGNDIGTQYRSGIYVFDENQRQAAEASKRPMAGRSLRAAAGRSRRRSAMPGPFYYAEDYHQQYLAKNPNGYCGIGGTGVACQIGTGVAAG